MRSREKLVFVLACVVLLAASLTAGAAPAGGEVAGTVTDPKGAVVAGATVTVLDPLTNVAVASATTDAQGKFRVPGLPPGSYAVVVRAEGFNEARRAALKVEEGKTAAADFRLEVSLSRESVTVTAAGSLKPNTDPVYTQLRAQSREAGPSFAVNNLVLKRDAATFTLRAGELYFMPPVEGRAVAAVFIGEGELQLAPPELRERRSLKLFTGSETLAEPFTELVLRFSDQTLEEVKASPAASPGAGGQAARALELFRANQSLARRQMRRNLELRALVDLLSPSQRPGFFSAFVKGKRYDKLVFQLDPLGVVTGLGPGGVGGSVGLGPEQVALGSYAQEDWGIWASFHMAGEYQRRTADSKQNRRLSNILAHTIEAAIRGTKLTASDHITLRAHATGTRVLPFDLYPGLRVTRVQDEQGQDLHFIQEDKDEDGDFAVVFPQGLLAAKTYKLTVQYEGEGAVRDYGGGNFSLETRANWYPSNGDFQFGDRATFDITFRYPKGNTFVGVGAPAGAEAVDGEMRVAKWSSGATELAVAGFNYGKLKKKEVVDKDTGYRVEFYANTSLPPDIEAREAAIRMAETATGQSIETLSEGEIRSTGAASTTSSADRALADTQNALRIYNTYFGKLPYERIAISQQPEGFFGQAWPTLVYMPYGAFLDQATRAQLYGTRMGTNTFFEYVGAHEVAHQWWGHTLGWSSYRDQWMSEGFSEFATSIWVQKTLGVDKFNSFWERQRREIVEAGPQTKGLRPYEVGAVTQGLRLLSGKTGAVYQLLVYPKGAYILHMLRMMMWDNQNPNRNPDEPFQKMMQDFVRTNYNKDVSTEDFKRAVEKHMTAAMDLDGNRRMDWFFNQWVYGTEVPAYRFEYQLDGPTLTARVTQSGVSDNFRMLVPVYLDFGKGWVRLGSATIVGNSTVELGPLKLPQAPKKVAAAALHDVLATSIEVTKK
jgi:Carboxypeptidase regulatory-like domain/Peptidase family M1 domain